jgi:hypothetical protein
LITNIKIIYFQFVFISFRLTFQYSILAIETAIKYYPATSIYGCTMLIDVANPTARHILQIQPSVLMNLVHTWQSCYPMRYQKIVFFNVLKVFDVILGIIRSFMTAKIKSRFYVYSNAIDCFEDIPANILPVEYNGTDGTLKELTGNYCKLNRYKCDAYWTIHKSFL